MLNGMLPGRISLTIFPRPLSANALMPLLHGTNVLKMTHRTRTGLPERQSGDHNVAPNSIRPSKGGAYNRHGGSATVTSAGLGRSGQERSLRVPADWSGAEIGAVR